MRNLCHKIWLDFSTIDDMADALSLTVLNYTRGDKLKNISDDYPEDSLGNKMGIWL